LKLTFQTKQKDVQPIYKTKELRYVLFQRSKLF